MFCTNLRISSGYFPTHHELIGLHNRDGKRLLRGTTWTFKRNSGQFPSFKGWQLTHHTQCISNQLTQFCIPVVNFLLCSEHPISPRLFGRTFHSQIKTFLSSRLLFCELTHLSSSLQFSWDFNQFLLGNTPRIDTVFTEQSWRFGSSKLSFSFACISYDQVWNW